MTQLAPTLEVPAGAEPVVQRDLVVVGASAGGVQAPQRLVAAPASQPIDLVEAELGREPLEGQPSLLTCPDCGGVPVERDEGDVIRFACQVGHAHSPGSLVEERGSALESAPWSAMRTLQERADLLRRTARRAKRSGNETTQRWLEGRAEGVAEQAGVVRDTILRPRGADATPPSA